MSDVYSRIKTLGIVLPEPPPLGGVYRPIKQFSDKLIYTSGFGAVKDGVPAFTGKVGVGGRTVSYAQSAARLCILNILAALEKEIGDLNKIKSVVKLLGFVASKEDFTQQPIVMNAASELLGEIFGKGGEHARSAIGTNVLPLDLTVEIELVLELH